MNEQITGTIKNTLLFSVEGIQFIYGSVVNDRLQRFNSGDWICSSPISKICTEDMVVFTRNSIYKVDTFSDEIKLNIEQFKLVRQGVSPDTFVKDEK